MVDGNVVLEEDVPDATQIDEHVRAVDEEVDAKDDGKDHVGQDLLDVAEHGKRIGPLVVGEDSPFDEALMGHLEQVNEVALRRAQQALDLLDAQAGDAVRHHQYKHGGQGQYDQQYQNEADSHGDATPAHGVLDKAAATPKRMGDALDQGVEHIAQGRAVHDGFEHRADQLPDLGEHRRGRIEHHAGRNGQQHRDAGVDADLGIPAVDAFNVLVHDYHLCLGGARQSLYATTRAEKGVSRTEQMEVAPRLSPGASGDAATLKKATTPRGPLDASPGHATVGCRSDCLPSTCRRGRSRT